MSNTFYNRSIRKLVVGFGNLFNDITLVRYNPDLTEQERFIVPIAYATKERYVMRLQEDPNLDKKVQITLPRMSFEMTGFSYDASRKQNTNSKNFVQTPAGVVSQYNPVPYNFNFSLYVYVRNIEDGTQIIEHILPYFTPDYTIKLNMIPEMGIVKEVPVVLGDVSHEINYEGPRENDTRTIIWTLNFTVKAFLFGPVSSVGGLIQTSITNILSENTSDNQVVFGMSSIGIGTYKQQEIIYQGYSLGTASASATVVNWANTLHELTVSGISGNFVSSQPIIGSQSNAKYNFSSYKVQPLDYAQIVVTPNPSTANANSSYTYHTTITETPNIANTYPTV